MIITYKDLLIYKLSGITEWKNEKEMILPSEYISGAALHRTYEFLGDGKYVLREYFQNEQIFWKSEYQNDEAHGLYLGWHDNGQLHWRKELRNGHIHGIDVGWWRNGRQHWRTEFQNSIICGEDLVWYKSGLPKSIRGWKNGERYSEMRWDENGKRVL